MVAIARSRWQLKQGPSQCSRQHAMLGGPPACRPYARVVYTLVLGVVDDDEEKSGGDV